MILGDELALRKKSVEAHKVMREANQVLRILDGRMEELEAVKHQIEVARSEVARLKKGLKKAIEAYEEVKKHLKEQKGKWHER